MRIEKKTSLMDVFQRKGKISDYLYGQDEYFVGDRKYGSMYDVAARGKQIKALDSVDDLLGNMPGETFSTNTPRTLGDFNPELRFDISKFNTFPNKTIEPDPIYQDLRGTEDEMGKLGGGFG